MNKSILAHIRPGKIADKPTIEKIMVKYPTVFGFALQHEGELVHEHFTSVPTAQEIIDTITEAKDGHRLLMFGNWPKFEDESDLPPFIVTNAEGAPILAMMYEGNFPNYAGMNGKHTDEYCVADEILFPRIEKAYDAAGSDFDKFMVEMKGRGVKTVFESTFKDRAWFAFLPYTGEPFFFGANTLMKGFDWGTLSNTEGLDFEPDKVEEPKKSGVGFLNRKKPATATPAPDPEPKPVSDPAVVQPAPEPKKPGDIIPAGETTPIYQKVKVPPHLQGGVRNAWIRLFNGDRAQGLVMGDGDLPPDHQSKVCEIPVHSSLLEFTKINVNDTKSIKALREQVMKGKPADVLQFTPKEDNKSSVREPATNYTIEMSDDEATKTMEKLIKFLDAAAKTRVNPVELMKEASKRPPFSEKMGIDRHELLLRSDAEYLNLFDGNRTAVAVVRELKNWVISAGNIDLEKIVTPVKETEQVPVPVPSQDAPAAAPVKKAAIGFLKKKTGTG